MPRSIPIKNLAEYKRSMQLGAEFMPTYHAYHPDTVGLVRVVSEVHTNGFYSKVKDQPEHPLSMSNHGKGFFTPFEKASNYHYGDSSIDCLNSKTGEVIYTFEIYGIQNQEREEKNMNEWARLERQAERYKKEYPEGTRIMLLSMGDDPRPIEPNTRGTVKHVDDIGTIHCHFDNGRSLGIVPGEDSFRKLTAEELAEENEEFMDESEDGPVMGM